MNRDKTSKTSSRLEHRRQHLLSPQAFVWRCCRYVALAGGLVVTSLGGGMVGYHELEGLSWLDSFLNSAMILGGMGPVNTLQTEAGKLFAGSYALFSGLVFLVVVGLVFAPLVHRLMHLFHFDGQDLDDRL